MAELPPMYFTYSKFESITDQINGVKYKSKFENKNALLTGSSALYGNLLIQYFGGYFGIQTAKYQQWLWATEIQGEAEQNFPMLQHICLNTIIKNFEKFMAIYSTPELVPDHHVFKRHCELLQKISSKSLFQVFQRSELFVKYVDFFLNPHLQAVDIMLPIRPCDALLALNQIKVIGSTLTDLNLSYNFPMDWLSDLVCHLPQIRSLGLHWPEISHSVFNNIGKFCPLLENLDIAFCRDVTDDKLQELYPDVAASYETPEERLCGNHKLQYLDLSVTSVTYKGIAFVLERFPNILSIKHNDVFRALHYIFTQDSKNTSLPPRKYNLKELKILFPCEPVYLEMCSLICPHLTTLIISSIAKQSAVDACMKFTELKEVAFHLYGPRNVVPFLEVGGSNLTSLCLAGDSFKATVQIKSLVKNCPKLKFLSLTSVTFEPIRELALITNSFQNLKYLVIGEMEFNCMNIMQSVNWLLSHSPNLETLKLCYGTVTPEFVDYIANHIRDIREIVITECVISVRTAEQLLLEASNLKKYTLVDRKLTLVSCLSMLKLRPSVKLVLCNEKQQ